MLKGSSESLYNEVHLRTNCIGPCFLYKLLLPILMKTAAYSPVGSVRVLWAGSIAVHVNAPTPGGMEVDSNGKPMDMDVLSSYG